MTGRPPEQTPRPSPAPGPDPLPPRPSWLLAVRGLVFVVVTGFLWSGFVHNQVLEREHDHYLPSWVMFGGAAVGRSQVEYWIVHEDGSREVIDPYEVLGLERSKRSKQVFYIYGGKQAERLGQKLCTKLEPGTDLRARIRTARRDRWKIAARGKRNLCKTKGGRS